MALNSAVGTVLAVLSSSGLTEGWVWTFAVRSSPRVTEGYWGSSRAGSSSGLTEGCCEQCWSLDSGDSEHHSFEQRWWWNIMRRFLSASLWIVPLAAFRRFGAVELDFGIRTGAIYFSCRMTSTIPLKHGSRAIGSCSERCWSLDSGDSGLHSSEQRWCCNLLRFLSAWLW